LEFFITDWSGTTDVTISGNVANAWLLSVSSSPVAGIAIGGSAPGVTDYSGEVTKGAQVTLTAPAFVTIHGTDYTFQNWVLGGVPQADGVTDLTFQMTGDMDAEADYLGIPRNLTVLSDPIDGVDITGSEDGTTNYSTVVTDNTQVTLTAPATITDGDSVYGFTGWSGLGTKGTALTQHFRITSDMTLTATYGLIEMAVVYPNDPGIILERGKKVSVLWDAVNLPKGIPVTITLVKGGTLTWTLSAGTTKTALSWTVGAPISGAPAYPDGDDYTIVVSALDGAVLAESENPFAIATVQSLHVSGPTSVQGGTLSPPQYTCTAHFNFGGDMDVTSLVKWSCSPTTYAKIGKTGLLSTKKVTSAKPYTITATYGKGKPPLTDGLQISVTP
jgi:hypothetical protein